MGKRSDIDNEVDSYYQLLMKFKRRFEIKLKSYVNAVTTGNKMGINYKSKDLKNIIERDIEIYYLLVFIIEYVVSYDMIDTMFFSNLKEGMVIDE